MGYYLGIVGTNPVSGTSPTGSKIICEDMDECKTPSFALDCDVNADCINTRGSYKCQCKIGYEANSYDGTEGAVPSSIWWDFIVFTLRLKNGT